jgi:hypothetical protein
MAAEPRPIVCMVCNTRTAVYQRKKPTQRKPHYVCATCMTACRAAFGDKNSDFKRIKYSD